MQRRFIIAVVVQCLVLASALASPFPDHSSSDGSNNGANQCRKTKVAVLGAGVTGITAGWALSNASISDFLIVEYTDQIGGRCRHAPFGKDKNGKPYTVELGANWVQGLVTKGGLENPIWTQIQKYNITNYFSNLESLQTFDESGPVDYLDKLYHFYRAYEIIEQDAGYKLVQNQQDVSFRSASTAAGWYPLRDPQAQAIEWYEMDYEYAQLPDLSSEIFTVANYNNTYYGFSEANNYVFDQRGYNTFIHGMASEYMTKNDPRLLLNTIVKDIAHHNDSTTITMRDGSCIEADYAIVTFSVGVLQSRDVTFHPPLPAWKQAAIDTFQLGVYTKIFFQFPPDKIFWDQSKQFFLYANKIRGYYPVWQSLDHKNFLPGSGIFFVTVVTEQSYIVDRQDDETTKAQIMATLRQMYGADNVPEPTDFMYPRWSLTPWAYGSYSNWPPGMTLEAHQNLRANVGRVWFAGEATSSEFYGYLQGAYYEGEFAGSTIASCLKKGNPLESLSNVDEDVDEVFCKQQNVYDVLGGTTILDAYSPDNGWWQTSFQTIGDTDLTGGGG